jgi:hypothetical protein
MTAASYGCTGGALKAVIITADKTIEASIIPNITRALISTMIEHTTQMGKIHGIPGGHIPVTLRN